MQFFMKFGQNYMLVLPARGLAPPPREILDPPLPDAQVKAAPETDLTMAAERIWPQSTFSRTINKLFRFRHHKRSN